MQLLSKFRIKSLFKKFKIKNNTSTIPFKTTNYFYNISKKLDKKGKSFSKVQLKNIKIIDKTLFAELNHQSIKKKENK